MLVLLPPSEGKSPAARGRPLDLDRLSFPSLTHTRACVLDAVAEVSAHPSALAVLGVPPTLGDEVARNTHLRTAPTASVGAVYSGVLYDALSLGTLDPAAARRAHRWVVVASALFGALRLRDRIPAYRLSMKVNLPTLGPLAGVWRTPLARVLPEAAGRGLVVDCRSSTYAAAWVPRDSLAARWVQVRVPGATHMAKHTRGLVARHLCAAGEQARTPAHLAAAVSEAFDTQLVAPERPGQPWVLWVSAQPVP